MPSGCTTRDCTLPEPLGSKPDRACRRIDPRDNVGVVVVVRTIGLEGDKDAAEENLAVGLQGHRVHLVAGVGIERGVDGAVGIEPCDIVALVVLVAPLGCKVVNAPPTKILPSACCSSAPTRLPALGSKVVSSDPSVLSCAIRLRGVPQMFWNRRHDDLARMDAIVPHQHA